ncbi:MAG: hypothetical protein U1E33_09005 [Rhodospirillales bacterium]
MLRHQGADDLPVVGVNENGGLHGRLSLRSSQDLLTRLADDQPAARLPSFRGAVAAAPVAEAGQQPVGDQRVDGCQLFMA